MQILKVFIALVIAYVSFKISISITNSLVHFEIGMGAWLVNLFILSPKYLVVLLGLSGLIGFGAWNTLSYILILLAVNTENDKNPTEYTATTHTQPKIKRPSIIDILGKTLMGLLGMIGVAIIILIAGVINFAQMGESFSKSNQKRFEKKFEKHRP